MSRMRTMGTLAAALLLAGYASASLAADEATADQQASQQAPASAEQQAPQAAGANEQNAGQAAGAQAVVQPAAGDSQDAK